MFAVRSAAVAAVVLLAWPSMLAATDDAKPPTRSSGATLAGQRLRALRTFSIESSGCVNEPDCEDEEVVIANSLQSETSIAVDSTGQHVVVGFNDFRGFFVDATRFPTSISGFMYSDDGGRTFVNGGQLPSPGNDAVRGQLFPQIFGDPDVKYVSGCTFVYTSIALEKLGADGVVQSLAVHRSTDCGHTWEGPFKVPPSQNPNGLVDVNGDAVDAADKELSDVDPDTGRYGVCWTNFTTQAPGEVEISCTYSDNILEATPSFAPRRVIAARTVDGQGSALRFAGNGSPNAVVAWSTFPGGYLNNVSLSRSTDNGVTWSAPINLTANFLTMDQVPGNDRINSNPSVAIDKSNGPFANRVYVVYSNNNSQDGADVALQRSADGGVTFSAPVLLNSRPGNDRAQWFPYVTIDRTTGRVHVFYYDQGIDTSGDLAEVTHTFSDDGGVSWSKPAPITDRPFRAGFGNDTSQPNLGDYNQAVAQFATLYMSYALTRQVGFADGQPSTSMTTPDVEAKALSSTRAAVRLGTVAFTETGGNGNIDAGDDVLLQIPLQNYVTNPLSASPVAGIAATLTTSAADVTVVQAASAYPDLAPGATAPNTTAFRLQIPSTFAPGTPIPLELDVSTAQGTTTLPFTVSTGTPVYTTLLSENFDGVAPGTMPAGWTRAHGAGATTVPWTTDNTFCGGSNKAFHTEANDVPNASTFSRWERLFSPAITVPAASQYVSVDFDVCYDTEDDPVLRVLGYDGVFLRLTDLTPGRTLRSVLAEAFAQEFTTGAGKHYPKHFPRNGDPSYFEDMSAWAGDSGGVRHVHMTFPGMAGSQFQLRFEYAQDQLGLCTDVRPGHRCGVAVDNVVVRNFVAVTPLPAQVTFGQSLARDPATGEIVLTLTLTNPGGTAATNVRLTSVLLGTTPTLTVLPSFATILPGQSVMAMLRFPGSAATPGAPTVVRIQGVRDGANLAASLRAVAP